MALDLEPNVLNVLEKNKIKSSIASKKQQTDMEYRLRNMTGCVLFRTINALFVA